MFIRNGIRAQCFKKTERVIAKYNGAQDVKPTSFPRANSPTARSYC